MTIAVAEGIGAQAAVNMDCQTTTALTVISLIQAYFPLQQAWSNTLNQDAENIFLANLNVPGNPGGTAAVAAAIQARNTDSTDADLETGNINTIIQGQKGQAQLLGNAVSNTFNLEEPLNDLLRAQSDAILSFQG